MKFLPGRMLGSTGNCTRGACTAHGEPVLHTRGAWRALLPLRMKILPGRTALKTLELMSSSLLGITSRTVILL